MQTSESTNELMHFTHFASRPGPSKEWMAKGVRHLTCDWPKLTRLLTLGSKATVKAELDAWCPAQFKDLHRTEANTVAVSCLVLDVDNKKGKERVPDAEVTTIQGVLTALAGQQLLIYTSFSDAPGWPRFRIVLPLSRAVTASEYEYLWAGYVAWLDGVGIGVDTSTRDPSRLWYLGSRSTVKTHTGEGELLDPNPWIAHQKAEQKRLKTLLKKSAGEVSDRVQNYLDKCDPAVEGAEGSRVAFSVIRRVVRGFDLSDDAALSLLQSWNNRCSPPWADAQLLHKIKDARDKGTKPEIGVFLKKEKPVKPVSTIELARMRVIPCGMLLGRTPDAVLEGLSARAV